ncbi:MAG TPA: lipopolysaccharide heptosyltransferase I [Burkholderiales bacterium]|nr:lipopolysaccharide heptosyltransferase I [Burkholderiales bacterium]
MRRILLVKTSSLGDVIHNLPVASDIAAAMSGAEVDWVVEEAFAAIPALHPAVRQVIPVAMRRWRKNWLLPGTHKEMGALKEKLGAETYDMIVDTQGLLKSAVIARWAKGPICGQDWVSAREPAATLLYDRTFTVDRALHAVERNRLLASHCLRYKLSGPPVYGIRAPEIPFDWLPAGERYVVFLHATSREDKLWAEDDWAALGERLHEAGYRAVLPWGSAAEHRRSERLAARIPHALAAPKLTLESAAALLARAAAVAGVDTGLTHLAAALGLRVVGIYCGSDPGLTGVLAPQAVNLGGAGAPPSVDEVAGALGRGGIIP